MNPILYVDLLKQSSYKNIILLSMMHKQYTYFSKKYSKSNRITLNKTNRLSKVCEKDNIKATKYIHKKINTFEHDNFVFKNAGNGNIRVLRYFLNNGYDINTMNETFCCPRPTLLSYDESIKHLKIMKLLLDTYKVDIYRHDCYLLWKSIDYRNIKTTTFLLNKGANVHYHDDIALVWSAKYGYIESVKLLLDYGADIHARNNLALGYSAENGHVEVVRLLLNHGADIHAQDNLALRYSAENGHVEVVKLLLEKGANIHECENYALRYSAYNGHFKVVKLLLDAGADIHAINDSALRVCVRCGNANMVKLLLERGAYVRALGDRKLRQSTKEKTYKSHRKAITR